MLVLKKNVKRCIEYCVYVGSFVSVYMYSRWYFSFIRIFELEDIRVLENVKVFMELFN